MLAERAERPAIALSTSPTTFFRQSGWMVFATTFAGGMFYAVHFFAGRNMPADEYGVFNALLQVLNQMAIPAIGLQTIFVQQAALAESEQRRMELAGAVRSLLRATFIFWLVMAAVVLVFQQRLLADYKISNPAALWATVALGLVSLWTPVMSGILQGRQDFLWFGMVPVVSAGSRLLLIAMILTFLGGWAAGAMVGVLMSMVVALGLGAWRTFPFWRGQCTSFAWKPWLKRVAPLTLGLGATQFMFTWDMIPVQRFLEDTGLYGAAGMIGRALMFLIAPMTQVMFPKIVRSAARAERTDVLAQALGATALLAAGAALFCTLFPELPLRIVQGEKYLGAAKLVPWFAWCILPLTVSSVLVNNLLARERYAAVPWLVAVAVAYGVALWMEPFHSSHLRVIQTLGVFSLIFFTVCVWFTWQKRPSISGQTT